MPWKCFSCVKSDTEDIIKLDYRHYSLSDVPPEVFAFERTLEELYLDANRIKDLPRPLFHCHGLRHLGLSDNEIQNIPAAISSLVNLEYLDISKNGISDIPDNIKGCKLLKVVDASVNPLEKLPEGFMQLLALEELYLNDAYLEFLPANFGRLLKLRILELRENHLNTLPKSIARLVNLQRLDIGQNEFSDLPEVVGQLPNITELWCDFNRIRSIPQFVGNLKKLVHLDASNNNINWIDSEIQNCAKLSDLTLSGNEIQEVPDTIGNLSSLMTLKLDDNQLAMLPDTIGRLLNLEELILSQNDFETLPSSVGLLRRLHILNVDENMLEDLPPEIGSCCNLRILSVARNRLIQIPGEIGHLSNLKVINLSGNRINNLPVSLLGLSSLAALWLSDNQAQPLVPLQSDLDPITGQRILTCFMLPQTTTAPSEILSPTSVTPGYDAVGDSDAEAEARNEEERIRRRHIRFAADSELDAGGRLLRAPTPYPKELRALARHARSLQRASQSVNGPVSSTSPLVQGSYSSPKAKEGENVAPVVADWISSGMQENKIKEAKVTKSQTSPIIMTEVHDSGMKRGTQQPDQTPIKTENEIQLNQSQVAWAVEKVKKAEDIKSFEFGKERCDGHIATESPNQVFDAKCVSDISDKDGSVPFEEENDHISVECKDFVSAEVTYVSDRSSVPLKDVREEQEENVRFLPNSPSVPSHPPPYHIAAAYSKKAAFFNSDVQSRSSVSSLPPINLLGGRLTPLSEIKDVARPSSAASSKYDLPPMLRNQTVKDPSSTASQNQELEDNSSMPTEVQDVNETIGNRLNESNAIEEQISNYKASVSLQERQLKISVDSLSPKIDGTDSSMSTYQNICSVSSMKPSPPLESASIPNISIVNQELSETCSPSIAIIQPSRSMADDFVHNSESVQIEHGSSLKSSLLEDDDNQSSCENSSSILNSSSAEFSFMANSQMVEMAPSSKPGEFSAEKRHETPDLVKDSQKSGSSRIPISRIKPIGRLANEEIREMSLGKPPNFTQDKPAAGSHLIAPTPQRANTILTHSTSFEGGKDIASPMNDSCTGSNNSESIVVTPSRIPSVSGIPSPKTSPNWQQSSPTQYFASKVPQPGFALAKRSNANFPSHANSRQEAMVSPVLGVENSLQKVSPSTPLSKIPQLASQNNSPSTSGGRIPVKGLESREKSPKTIVTSKIPTLSSAWSDTPPGGDPASRSRIPVSPQSRPVKTWMFGLHKNALVFPVSIHKNPGLGFSIAGGLHHNASPDKQDNGIYITKIHPNGPACATLQPGDKILEVDGVDFTKLEHDHAVSILTQTGSVVQMMISRQQ